MNVNKFLILVLVVSASTMALGGCETSGGASYATYSPISCGNVKDKDICNNSAELADNSSCHWVD